MDMHNIHENIPQPQVVEIIRPYYNIFIACVLICFMLVDVSCLLLVDACFNNFGTIYIADSDPPLPPRPSGPLVGVGPHIGNA